MNAAQGDDVVSTTSGRPASSSTAHDVGRRPGPLLRTVIVDVTTPAGDDGRRGVDLRDREVGGGGDHVDAAARVENVRPRSSHLAPSYVMVARSAPQSRRLPPSDVDVEAERLGADGQSRRRSCLPQPTE